MLLKKWGDAAGQSVQVLKSGLLLGVLPTVILFFFYCAGIGFVPTNLSLSELLTGFFLLGSFAFFYAIFWVFLFYIGAPAVLGGLSVLKRIVHRHRRTPATPRPTQKSLRKLRPLALLLRPLRRDSFLQPIPNSLTFVLVLLFFSATEWWSSWLSTRLWITGIFVFSLTHLLVTFRLISRRPDWQSGTANQRISPKDIALFSAIPVVLPLVLTGDLTGKMLDLAMETARIRVSDASIRLPSHVPSMIPDGYQLRDTPKVLPDGSIVVTKAIVYMHRIGSEAFLGLPVDKKGSTQAEPLLYVKLVLKASEIDVMSQASP